MTIQKVLSLLQSLVLLGLLSACSHKVELCNIIDETPEPLNLVDKTPYSNNIGLISVKGGEADDCHQEGVVIPNRTLGIALVDMLMRKGFYSGSAQSTYGLIIVLDPPRQISRKAFYQATVTIKATLMNRDKNEVVFNERFETTLQAPNDAAFFPCCLLKIATENATRETLKKLIERIKILAYPPKPSAHPEPIVPPTPGSPELL